MAFAATNVQRTNIGNLKTTRGDWTGAVGDAAGTIGVEGGRVYFADFNIQPTAPSQYQVSVPYSVSTSGAVTTITVYYNEAVTAGEFFIVHS